MLTRVIELVPTKSTRRSITRSKLILHYPLNLANKKKCMAVSDNEPQLFLVYNYDYMQLVMIHAYVVWPSGIVDAVV